MDDFSQKEKKILKKSPLLNQISDENYNAFLAISSKAYFKTGDILLKEGENSDEFFIIISGSVGLYKKDHSTNTSEFITELSRGESIGEMRMVHNHPCSLTVKVSEPLIVLRSTVSQLRSPENHALYESILESAFQTINARLFNSNQIIINKINERKNKSMQFTLAVLGIIVLLLFICELYYAVG